MAQKIKTLITGNLHSGVRAHRVPSKGWPQIVMGHLSRTVSYQGRLGLHRALNG
mgnify:CR=1 FL=1